MVKIILVLMIRNEEKILRRCIENVLPLIDGISILDTGSTDGTVELAKTIIEESGKPGKVYVSEWKNFGYSRSESFNYAREFCTEYGFKLEDTIGLLLDADMVLKYPQNARDILDKIHETGAPGIRINQIQGPLKYFNTRFISMSVNWKCVGVTHEYWECGADTMSQHNIIDGIWIDDISDGGCKEDKFTRDIAFLEEGLKEEPENSRYIFYLAQSYYDIKEFEKAIELYKKRTEMGGWPEEIWYSMFNITRGYAELKNYVESEYWGLKTYNYNPTRAEPIYMLAFISRMQNQYYKAWEYCKLGKTIPYPTEVMLFLNELILDIGLKVEEILLRKHITNTDNHIPLQDCLYLIGYKNKSHVKTGFSGIKDYAEKLKTIEVDRIDSDHNTTFAVKKNGIILLSHSNASILPDNTREAEEDNFIINEVGGCSVSHLDSKMIRSLFLTDKNELRYIANIENGEFLVGSLLTNRIHSVLKSDILCRLCVNFDNNKFIRSWKPIITQEIGNNIGNIVSDALPEYFNHCVSVCSGAKYGDKVWFIVYVSIIDEDNKATVFHSFIVLNNDATPYGYSLPFYFNQHGIENCSSFDIRANKAEFIVSYNGKNNKVFNADMAELEKLLIHI